MELMRALLSILLSLPFLSFSNFSQADTTHIAVASNFTGAMKELIAEFEKSSPHSVKASYGSSGKIYAQIQHGAPFQIFFSADQAKPLALYQQGLAQKAPFTYAFGALALWSSHADLQHNELDHLQSNDFNRLSLANPKLAPYGIATLEVLESLNLIHITQKKWVKGENIAQAYQFVGSGNADLGFVALSQVINKTNYWPVPSKLYNPIRQDAVLLSSSQNNLTAIAFLEFIRSKESQAIIESHGYSAARNPLTMHKSMKDTRTIP